MEPERRACELATTEHWESRYAAELRQVEETGTFGEEWYEAYQEQVLDWIDEHWEDWSAKPRADASVVDLGTGNGVFVLRLTSIGFRQLTGVDYLQEAVDCASAIHQRALKQDLNGDLEATSINESSIHFLVDDIMSPDANAQLPAADFIHDKGTLDVFYLRSQMPQMLRQVERKYRKNPGCVWVVSSGNLTQDELKTVVETHTAFRELARRPAPRFSFAGAHGVALSTLAFRL